ncbi:MAG: DUF6282 family protein [Tepidibacillus sp.]
MDNSLTELLLKDAIDIHVHTGPSIFPRLLDDIQLANEAKKAGMKGIIIKAHEGSTVDRAYIASKQTGFQVKGSIVLNHFVGGFNVYAAELAIKMGSKIVWMPTTSAKNHLKYYGGGEYKAQQSEHRLNNHPGYTILDSNNKLLPEVREILKLIAENDSALGTGHLSIEEVNVLVKEAIDVGIEKILIAHPDLNVTNMPLDLQIELASKGVYIEKSMLTLMPNWKSTSCEQVAFSIKKIGSEHCIMQTDFGQINHPSPVEGMRMFITKMLEQGLTQEEIKQMTSINPLVFFE